MAVTGANKRAIETQKDGAPISWQEIISIIGYAPSKIPAGTKGNVTPRQIAVYAPDILNSHTLTPEVRFNFAMRILDVQASHTFGNFASMLRLVGERKLAPKQEEAIISKMYSIKGRDELLEDVLVDLEKRPHYRSTKLRTLFKDSNHPERFDAGEVAKTLSNIPEISTTEIPKIVKALTLA